MSVYRVRNPPPVLNLDTARILSHQLPISLQSDNTPQIDPDFALRFVGCSNSYQSVWGYNTLASKAGAFINPHYETGAGSLWGWYANENNHRTIFTNNYVATCPVWWQLCIRTGEGGSTAYQMQAEAVAEWLIGVVGSVPVWVSTLNTYEEPEPGRPPQVTSHAHHIEIRNHLVSEYGFLNGPTPGPLSTSLTNDGTHPNSAGRLFIGAQLREFFDPLVIGSSPSLLDTARASLHYDLALAMMNEGIEAGNAYETAAMVLELNHMTAHELVGA